MKALRIRSSGACSTIAPALCDLPATPQERLPCGTQAATADKQPVNVAARGIQHDRSPTLQAAKGRSRLQAPARGDHSERLHCLRINLSRSQGTEDVSVNGMTISDVKPLKIAYLFHRLMKLFNAPRLVIQTLKLRFCEGFKRCCVWQEQDVVTVFVFEDRAKDLDPAKLFEWHQHAAWGNLSTLDWHISLGLKGDETITLNGKEKPPFLVFQECKGFHTSIPTSLVGVTQGLSSTVSSPLKVPP